MKLKDKVCIITGAGQGIGEAYARRFVEEGASVVVGDINQEKGRAVAASLGKAAVFERVDVSSEEDTKRAAAAVGSRFGRIDVLINNAAIFHDIDNRDYSYQYLRKIFDVNYFGAWLMSRAVLPAMKDKNSGVIIHQSSTAAFMHPVMPLDNDLPSFHYSITKAALNALTHYMAGCLGIYGIRVNAISPGPTMTDATKAQVPQEYLELIVNMMMAIKRPLEPDDLPGTAVWLASDDSRMVTGQVIPVDGGMVMLG